MSVDRLLHDGTNGVLIVRDTRVEAVARRLFRATLFALPAILILAL